ncbi:MAG: galactokinase family protein, partial [Firmicutes bacterium]|nr:galactokinase family protein [Bacillota bacterium]
MLVSTPSRLCLFGEHLDYLELEVIAVAINLRFSAEIA